MAETLDARGLSCPQPVLLTMEKLRSLGQGELQVVVDTDTAVENVSRVAASLGWEVARVNPHGREFRLTLQKGKEI